MMIIDLQAERHNLDIRLQRLSEADDGFNKTLATIFTLASKAHDLFKSSKLEEKRRIISILFSNLEMSAEKLVFKPRKHFDVFLNLPHRPNWLPRSSKDIRICVKWSLEPKSFTTNLDSDLSLYKTTLQFFLHRKSLSGPH